MKEKNGEMRMTYIMPQDPTNSKPIVPHTQNSAINPQNCIEENILPLLPAVDLSFILIHLFFLPKLNLYMCVFNSQKY